MDWLRYVGALGGHCFNFGRTASSFSHDDMFVNLNLFLFRPCKHLEMQINKKQPLKLKIMLINHGNQHFCHMFPKWKNIKPEKGGTKARGAQGAEAGKVYGGGGRRSAGRKVRRI